MERNALWHTTLRKQWLSFCPASRWRAIGGGIPAWTVEGDDLAKVNDFLKKSCMEFCGSLPGDEKDEDGYSLSGEAKDATASRNGLSRNQMGIEEKAAECKEAATVLANGNAL